MPYDIEPYLGKSFKTNNSIWSVSKDGIMEGNSKYFQKHPEMVGAKVKYIGGITREKLIETHQISNTNEELENNTINALTNVGVGNRLIIGATPFNDLEKMVQILTSPVDEILE